MYVCRSPKRVAPRCATHLEWLVVLHDGEFDVLAARLHDL